MKDLIHLQNAHVTQITTEQDGKGPWMVRQNLTSDDLHELPSHLSEQDVFTCLEFARKFELIAFNAGIDFQKKQQRGYAQMMAQENQRLSNVIEKLTKGE